MSTWTNEQLRAIGSAEELDLASRRPDRSLRPFVTMWVVVAVGDDLYVRSAGGPGRRWYRNALASGTGRIRAAGIETDVIFTDAPDDTPPAIDDAYHATYDRYGPAIVGSVVGPRAHRVTISLAPLTPPDCEGWQTMTTPDITLNNGVRLPVLGFGVYQIPPNDTERSVSDVLEVGYRHIDAAAAYANETEVGRAI